MATYQITIPDGLGPRILEAFGHGSSVPGAEAWVPATKNEVLAMMKDFVRQRVIAYETALAAETKSKEVQVEEW